MRKTTYLILAGTILATSCKKKNDDPPPAPSVQTAKVKFTNACFGSGPLKVEISDTVLTALTGIDYLASSSYLSVLPGSNAKVEFILANSNLTLNPTTNATFAVNNNYSVYATGVITAPSTFVTSDDLSAPASGKAKVRFVNVSPDTLNMRLFVGTTLIDSAVTYKEASGFVEVAPNASYQITATDPQIGFASRTISGQNIASGKIYSVLLVGSIDNNNLDLKLVEHN